MNVETGIVLVNSKSISSDTTTIEMAAISTTVTLDKSNYRKKEKPSKGGSSSGMSKLVKKSGLSSLFSFTSMGKSTSVSDNITATCSSEFTLTSCMKGTQSMQAKKRKQKVRFSSTRNAPHTTHPIEPYYHYDLWWRKAEFDSFKSEQSNFTIVSDDIRSEAISYLSAYSKARQQVYNNNTEKPMMSVDNYQALVAGRVVGFAGLELYSEESITRRKKVKEIILLVVAAYYDFTTLNAMPNADKIVRSYARSLTAPDRYWSVASGNADREAIAKDIEC